MSADAEVVFTHAGPDGLEALVERAVVPLYQATHTDVIDDPFYGVSRFLARVRGYARSPGFEIVVAEAGNTSVAQAFGYPLPENARWWSGLTTAVDPEAITEDGTRTFALCELMVHPQWQRRGIARALHSELMIHRPEQRATLLVREDNTVARRAYGSWGWRRFGKLQPYPDSPHYDALVYNLER